MFNLAMSMVAGRAWDGDAGPADGEAVMRWSARRPPPARPHGDANVTQSDNVTNGDNVTHSGNVTHNGNLTHSGNVTHL